MIAVGTGEPCPFCKGSGWLVTDHDDVNNNDLEEECPFCLGEGKYQRITNG